MSHWPACLQEYWSAIRSPVKITSYLPSTVHLISFTFFVKSSYQSIEAWHNLKTMLQIIKEISYVILCWHTHGMLLLCDEHAFMPFRQSGAVPHGTNRIQQSFHSDSGCSLRHWQKYRGLLLMHLPIGPRGRSWFTCHSQGNVLLFDTGATIEVVRKCVFLIWGRTGCIIDWVMFQYSEGDGCWFLKTRNQSWSIFTFEYYFDECAWNIPVS